MLNHIALLGRLTDMPVLRTVGQGISNAKFTLAVNRDFKSKETGDYETDFIDITAWRGTADFVGKYFTKGQLVVVEGRLEINSYTDREGIRRKGAQVVASQVHFAEPKRDTGNNYASNFTPPPPQTMGQNPPNYGQQGNNYGGAYTPPAVAYPNQGGEQYTPPASGGGYSIGGSYQGAQPDTNQGGDNFRTLTPAEEKNDLPF